ncbi:MAG: hypothetical protein A4E58_00005 [Syntrophorhabdus sp. PtaB.Bin006]|nr:MAG: hypothetical protein A4E58_00005 [Syntrophorhabdus sp. PtaB.Bin006]
MKRTHQHKIRKTIAPTICLLKGRFGYPRLKGVDGFTLIEIIAVIVVLSILAGFMFSFIEYAIRTYLIGSKQSTLHQEASYIMERVSRELRDAQVVYVRYAGSDVSRLYIQPRAHPTGMDNNLNVEFWRNETDLVRTTASVHHTFGSRVTQFKIDPENCLAISLGYYRCSASDPRGALSVTISVMDQGIPLNNTSSQTVTFTTKISPRNYTPAPNQYTGRYFNGDYEDVIQ